MKQLKNIIPNLLTSFNLIAGLLSLMYLFVGNFQASLIMILFAGLFDFLDGAMARWLNAGSEFGKQLDSLADAVSFGVVPGVMAFLYLKLNISLHPEWPISLSYVGLSLTVFALYRLARYNASNNESIEFRGLAAPAMAIFVCGLVWYLLSNDNLLTNSISQVPIFISIIIIVNVLMISNITMFSLKFETFSFKNNIVRWIFLAISVGLLLIFKLFALPLIITFYVFLSVIIFLIKKKL